MAATDDLQCSQAAIPPYPKEIARRPYPANYTPPIFPKYDGMTWNAREHIRWYVDTPLLDEKLTLSNLQHEKQRVSEGLLEFIRKFRDLSLLCYVPVEEERLVDVCIIGHNNPMEEEAENMASSSLTPPPLVDEEMVTRIEQDDKMHFFLDGIGFRPMATREAAQALIKVMERNHEVASVKGSLKQVAYQEANDSVTFSNKDLVN
nr:hypothetical protein CFP56_74650 [Quercus suber]